MLWMALAKDTSPELVSLFDQFRMRESENVWVVAVYYTPDWAKFSL
jgi:hypothetical protein